MIPSRLDERLSALSHALGNASKVAFFPKCFVWIHVGIPFFNGGCDAPNVCRGDTYHPIEIERVGNPADCKTQSIAPNSAKIVDRRGTVGRWRSV